MKFASKALVASLILVASVAVAKEGVQDPTVKARMDLMGVNSSSTKILMEFAQEKNAFDAAAAEAARAELLASAKDIAAKFEPPATDPVSDALPEIWTQWDDFVAKSNDLVKAAEGIDTTTLAGVQAGMMAVGEACKECHSTYRVKR
jgi:cytochrome c556